MRYFGWVLPPLALLLVALPAARADERPTLVMLIAEDEYDHKTLLPAFAEKFLDEDFKVIALHGSEDRSDEIVGLEEAMPEADVLLIAVRRRPLNERQTQLLREHIDDGKAVVGIRTASHAFDRSGAPGVQWPEFDPEILGGNYDGHHRNRGKQQDDPEETTYVWPTYAKRDHRILQGIEPDEAIATWSWLYRVRPLEEGAQVLMMGRVGNRLPTEPVAWTHLHPGDGRVFYTSLGHPEEFGREWFQRLLRNGIYWAAGLEVAEELPDP